MDNHHLRSILLKLQDRLSDDDRKRLHFFLGNDVPRRIRDDPSLSGTLSLMESLFDQDKINEQDFTFLINAFDGIQCLDAARVLRKHMKQIQSNEPPRLTSIMPHTIDDLLDDSDQDDRIAISNILLNNRTGFVSNNMLVEDHSTKPLTLVIDQQKTNPSSVIQKQLDKIKTEHRKYSYVFGIFLLIIAVTLIAITVGNLVVKSELKYREFNCLQEQVRLNGTILFLRDLQMKDNQTIQDLIKQTQDLKDQLQVTIGTTCVCEKWCNERGSPYGVCADGPACICSTNPMSKEYIRKECTCEKWCRKYGHGENGICGDGYTCICSS